TTTGADDGSCARGASTLSPAQHGQFLMLNEETGDLVWAQQEQVLLGGKKSSGVGPSTSSSGAVASASSLFIPGSRTGYTQLYNQSFHQLTMSPASLGKSATCRIHRGSPAIASVALDFLQEDRVFVSCRDFFESVTNVGGRAARYLPNLLVGFAPFFDQYLAKVAAVVSGRGDELLVREEEYKNTERHGVDALIFPSESAAGLRVGSTPAPDHGDKSRHKADELIKGTQNNDNHAGAALADNDLVPFLGTVNVPSPGTIVGLAPTPDFCPIAVQPAGHAWLGTTAQVDKLREVLLSLLTMDRDLFPGFLSTQPYNETLRGLARYLGRAFRPEDKWRWKRGRQNRVENEPTRRRRKLLLRTR
ncbi:unnamed protein product, partial [Amoebophrya sp. A120]